MTALTKKSRVGSGPLTGSAFWRAFFFDERGQSTTEYILILSVVVMIAMKFKTAFGTKLSNIVDKLGGQIDQATTDSNN